MRRVNCSRPVYRVFVAADANDGQSRASVRVTLVDGGLALLYRPIKAATLTNAGREPGVLLGDTVLEAREGSIKTPLLLFLRMADYFFSLVVGSLLMGSVFSFIFVPMDVVLLTPSLSAVWSSNCPVAFRPLTS
jgi:hypothetical protein